MAQASLQQEQNTLLVYIQHKWQCNSNPSTQAWVLTQELSSTELLVYRGPPTELSKLCNSHVLIDCIQPSRVKEALYGIRYTYTQPSICFPVQSLTVSLLLM